jgi:hypothetical protein
MFDDGRKPRSHGFIGFTQWELPRDNVQIHGRQKVLALYSHSSHCERYECAVFPISHFMYMSFPQFFANSAFKMIVKRDDDEIFEMH